MELGANMPFSPSLQAFLRHAVEHVPGGLGVDSLAAQLIELFLEESLQVLGHLRLDLLELLLSCLEIVADLQSIQCSVGLSGSNARRQEHDVLTHRALVGGVEPLFITLAEVFHNADRSWQNTGA